MLYTFYPSLQWKCPFRRLDLDKTLLLLIICWVITEIEFFTCKVRSNFQSIKYSHAKFKMWVTELCYTITVHRLTCMNYNNKKPHIEIATLTPSNLNETHFSFFHRMSVFRFPFVGTVALSLSLFTHTQAQPDIETNKISFYIQNLVAWLCCFLFWFKVKTNMIGQHFFFFKFVIFTFS